MDFHTPLSDLGIGVVEAMERLFPGLLKNTILLFAGLVLLGIGIAVLVRARRLRQAGWIYRKNAKMKGHYVYMVLLVVFLFIQACRGLEGLKLPFFIISFITAAAAIFGLLTLRRFGVTAMILGFWFTLPLREIPVLTAFLTDYQNLYTYSVPGKVGIYAAAVYASGRFVVLAMAAVLMTGLVTGYYTKRRYLFRENAAAYFGNAAACPKCGMPVVKAGGHCVNCGTEVDPYGFSELKWKPLEEDKYCPNCGHKLIKGDCVCCGDYEKISKTLKEELKDQLSDKAKAYIVIAIVALLSFIPLFLNDPLKYLTQDSAAVTNGYIAHLNTWIDTPAVADDAAWMTEYDASASALYELNSRGFNIIPERLSYSNLYVYLQYLEASYSQMAVMQEIDGAVRANDPAAFAGLGNYFNETMDQQLRALGSALSMITSDGNWILSGENMIVDSMRFWLSFIPVIVRIIVIFVCGAAALGFGIYLTYKSPDPSPFRRISFTAYTQDELAAQKAAQQKQNRSDRLLVLIVSVVMIALMAAFTILDARLTPEPELTYETALDKGFTEPGTGIVFWIPVVSTDPEDALASKEQVLASIDKSADAVAFLANYYLPASEDADSEETLRKVKAQQTAAQLQEALAELKAVLERNELPDQALSEKLLSLYIDGMEIDQRSKAYEALKGIEDLF